MNILQCVHVPSEATAGVGLRSLRGQKHGPLKPVQCEIEQQRAPTGLLIHQNTSSAATLDVHDI